MCDNAVGTGALIATGIAELDALLGGGFGPQGIVLLRGGPGVGKTTLALQILSHHLRDKDKGGAGGTGLFVSLEGPADNAWAHMKSAYRIEKPKGRYGSLEGRGLRMRILGPEARGAELGERFAHLLAAERTAVVGESAPTVPCMTVVDSLSTLTGVLQETGRKLDPDALFQSVSRALRDDACKGVILFLAEADPDSPNAPFMYGESFFCDTEIVLDTEEIVRPGGEAPGSCEVREERFFCRVRKAREQPRQVRRCAYDFVKDKGIVFYETYPGDGRVVLFQENVPMMEEWEVFRNRDIPGLYPTLEFETFDRSGLQRTFAGQRRLQHVPQRTDLLLHNFDSYWVSWYAELCQRTDIMSRLKGALKCQAASGTTQQEQASLVLSALHRLCNTAVQAMATALIGVVKRSEEQWRKDPADIDPVVDSPEGDHDRNFWFEKSGDFVQLMERPVNGPTRRWAAIPWKVFRKACTPNDRRKMAVDSVQLMEGMRWEESVFHPRIEEQCVNVSCAEKKAECAQRLAGMLSGTGIADGSDRRQGILNSFDGTGLLESIPVRDLRLYGERQSAILSELEEVVRVEARPTFRPFGFPATRDVIAVPYNANVGMMVVNQQALKAVLKRVVALGEPGIQEALTARYHALRGAEKRGPDGPGIDRMGELAKRLHAPGTDYCPQTWEEVLFLCEQFMLLTGEEDKFWGLRVDHGRPVAPCFPLLIETKTFDTYMATFLEMLWSTGIDLDIHPDYGIEGYDAGKKELSPPAVPGSLREMGMGFPWALRLFRTLFLEGFTRRNSSLDPFYTRMRLDQLKQEYKIRGADRWLFARHWYSTLVDTLTAKNPKRSQAYLLERADIGEELRLFAVPLSADEYGRQRKDNSTDPVHYACLGEWYLTILEQSENMALGIDLINNLMSSQKITERAFSCAGVPTVEEFYALYGEARCMNLPGRGELVPKSTWGEFRQTCLVGAKSRTAIFDYRHCIRELHGVLEYVRTAACKTPGGGGPSDEDLESHLTAALSRIVDLARRHPLEH